MANTIEAPSIGVVQSNLAGTSVQRANIEGEALKVEGQKIALDHQTNQEMLNHSQKFLDGISTAVKNVANVNANQHITNYGLEMSDIMSNEQFMVNSLSKEGLKKNKETITAMANKYKKDFAENKEGLYDNITPVEKEQYTNRLNSIWQSKQMEFDTKVNEMKIQRTVQADTTNFNNQLALVEDPNSDFQEQLLETSFNSGQSLGIPPEQRQSQLGMSIVKRVGNKIALAKQKIQAMLDDPTASEAEVQAEIDKLKNIPSEDNGYQYLREHLAKDKKTGGATAFNAYTDMVNNNTTKSLKEFNDTMTPILRNRFQPQDVILTNTQNAINNTSADYSNMQTTIADKQYSTNALNAGLGAEFTDAEYLKHDSYFYADDKGTTDVYAPYYHYKGSKAKMQNDIDDFNTRNSSLSSTEKIAQAKAESQNNPGFYQEYVSSLGYGRPADADQEAFIIKKMELKDRYEYDDIGDSGHQVIDALLNTKNNTVKIGNKTYYKDGNIMLDEHGLENAMFTMVYESRFTATPGKAPIGKSKFSSWLKKKVNNKYIQGVDYSSTSRWNAVDPDEDRVNDINAKIKIIKQMRTNPSINAAINAYGSTNDLDVAIDHWDDMKTLIQDTKYKGLYDNKSTLTQNGVQQLLGTYDSKMESEQNIKDVRAKINQDEDIAQIKKNNPNINTDNLTPIEVEKKARNSKIEDRLKYTNSSVGATPKQANGILDYHKIGTAIDDSNDGKPLSPQDEAIKKMTQLHLSTDKAYSDDEDADLDKLSLSIWKDLGHKLISKGGVRTVSALNGTIETGLKLHGLGSAEVPFTLPELTESAINTITSSVAKHEALAQDAIQDIVVDRMGRIKDMDPGLLDDVMKDIDNIATDSNIKSTAEIRDKILEKYPGKSKEIDKYLKEAKKLKELKRAKETGKINPTLVKEGGKALGKGVAKWGGRVALRQYVMDGTVAGLQLLTARSNLSKMTEGNESWDDDTKSDYLSALGIYARKKNGGTFWGKVLNTMPTTTTNSYGTLLEPQGIGLEETLQSIEETSGHPRPWTEEEKLDGKRALLKKKREQYLTPIGAFMDATGIEDVNVAQSMLDLAKEKREGASMSPTSYFQFDKDSLNKKDEPINKDLKRINPTNDNVEYEGKTGDFVQTNYSGIVLRTTSNSLSIKTDDGGIETFTNIVPSFSVGDSIFSTSVIGTVSLNENDEPIVEYEYIDEDGNEMKSTTFNTTKGVPLQKAITNIAENIPAEYTDQFSDITQQLIDGTMDRDSYLNQVSTMITGSEGNISMDEDNNIYIEGGNNE